jgi:BolA protein
MTQTSHGSLKAAIERKLSSRFAPTHLSIVDESQMHAGHAGHSGRSESHFRVEMVSTSFSGKSRVARHRMVNDALAEELRDHVHALALTLRAPDEANLE